MDFEALLKWVLTGIAALLGSAATVIVSLWKRDESRNAREITNLQTKLDECEKKHEEANTKILALSVEVASLKARVDGTDK